MRNTDIQTYQQYFTWCISTDKTKLGLHSNYLSSSTHPLYARRCVVHCSINSKPLIGSCLPMNRQCCSTHISFCGFLGSLNVFNVIEHWRLHRYRMHVEPMNAIQLQDGQNIEWNHKSSRRILWDARARCVSCIHKMYVTYMSYLYENECFIWKLPTKTSVIQSTKCFTFNGI